MDLSQNLDKTLGAFSWYLWFQLFHESCYPAIEFPIIDIYISKLPETLGHPSLHRVLFALMSKLLPAEMLWKVRNYSFESSRCHQLRHQWRNTPAFSDLGAAIPQLLSNG